ncbi:MAG: hypothetical protein M1824_004846 [Vezdaea acicularis]|nr:MAG: hypothetical protein M1824_004846 [Vezdaea acicularis]
MASQKCVHKGCGKAFTDLDEECVYHPGPPIFHEGQKGWKCCKPRVLTFDEFLSIPPCTTGKHSTIEETPKTEPSKAKQEDDDRPTVKPIKQNPSDSLQVTTAVPQPAPSPSPAPPESESDDPTTAISEGVTCRRKGCNVTYSGKESRDGEKCIHHPGQPIFHEGSKGWTCCKRRVLEFDEFMKIEGCKEKSRHLFVGKKKGDKEEKLETVRNDFYQTSSTLIASFYLKKIISSAAKIDFSTQSIDLDLPTADNKRYTATIPLFGPIDISKSTFKIMGTKLELTLVKSDGSSWPVLRSDDKRSGEIIQIGKAGKA